MTFERAHKRKKRERRGERAMSDEKQIIEDMARAKEALQAVVDASGTPNNVDVVSFLVNLRDVALKVRVALAALSLDGLSGAGAGESNIVSMERTPGKWVYEQTTDAHGIYSETGAMLGEMWRGIDAKFVTAAPERIAALEREVADLRAALSLDGPSEGKESETTKLKAALKEIGARTYSNDRGCRLKAQSVAEIFDIVAEALGEPTPSAPAPVQALTEDQIDALRLTAFKTNNEADRSAYFAAVSKWFQDRHYRRIASPAAIPGDRK